jgi:hypothetical protein
MKTFSFLIGAALLLNACGKHEIIPAPTPKADLKVKFKGLINNTTTEYTENVEGFTGITTEAKLLLPSPALSNVTYYSEMAGTSGKSIKVGIGTLNWDASVSNRPSTAEFDAYHNTNISPNYATSSAGGFIVTWKETTSGGVRVWTSKGTPYHLDQAVDFSRITQEDDDEGHYSKFRVTFDTWVYRTYQLAPVAPATVGLFTTDSLHIQNGVYDGWFAL